MTQVFGVLRTVLAAAAGYGVAKGWFGNEVADGIVNGLILLLTAGWSIYEKRTAPPAA